MSDIPSISLPKISVIIPVLNSAKTIEKALLSIIEQDYPKTEIIILDAGSTDGTVEIIKRYEKHIYYWHSKPDGNAYLALNMGAEKATGGLIAQLMADDWFEPGVFAVMGRAYLEHPEASIYSCGGRFVSFDEVIQQYRTQTLYTTPQQLELSFYNVCFAIPAMSSRFVKRTLIDEIGLFKPIDAQGKYIFSADREFLLRAIAHGAQHVIVDYLGHTYFSHAGSATFSKNRATQMKVCLEHMEIADNYLRQPNLTNQQRTTLRYWYNDQSVRYFLFKLMEFDFGSAWKTAQQGGRKFKLQWPIALFSTPCKIVLKKAYLQCASLLK